MSKLMQHEAKRWDSMTTKQLETRLGRITKLDKLACFIDVASYVNKHLYDMAVDRWHMLTGSSYDSYMEVDNDVIVNKVVGEDETITYDIYPIPRTKQMIEPVQVSKQQEEKSLPRHIKLNL